MNSIKHFNLNPPPENIWSAGFGRSCTGSGSAVRKPGLNEYRAGPAQQFRNIQTAHPFPITHRNPIPGQNRELRCVVLSYRVQTGRRDVIWDTRTWWAGYLHQNRVQTSAGDRPLVQGPVQVIQRRLSEPVWYWFWWFCCSFMIIFC